MIALDANVLIGYYNEKDSLHQAARKTMDRFFDGTWGRGLLLEYVFLEVVTVLLVRVDLPAAIEAGDGLLLASDLEFVPCSDLFGPTVDAFRAQAGTRLSFTDAAVITVAKQRAGGLVATFDAEFRKVPGITVVQE